MTKRPASIQSLIRAWAPLVAIRPRDARDSVAIGMLITSTLQRRKAQHRD